MDLENTKRKKRMSDSNKKKIYLLATIRNCARYLEHIFKNIDSLYQFHDVHCIFVYDNCTDNSADLLRNYSKKHPDTITIEELESNNSPLRTVRIAVGRNRCLEIMETKEDTMAKHFIMLDMDDVNVKPWKMQVINNYLDNFDNDDWDAISFSREPYYDIWALMIDDFYHHVWGFGPWSPHLVKYMKDYMKIKINICQTNSFPCRSAFNGFAIYKTEKFKNIRYDGTFSNFEKNNFISVEEKKKCLEKYKRYTKNPAIVMKQCSLPFLKEDEHCEHLFFHNMAIQKNNAVIKISKLSIL